MTATTITRDSLELLNATQIRTLLRSRDITLPVGVSKDAMIDAALSKLDALNPVLNLEIPQTPPTPETVGTGPAPELTLSERTDKIEAALGALFESETPATPAPEIEVPPAVKPMLDADAVAAKLEQHRARLAAEQAERDTIAETKKAKRQGWEPTIDELHKRCHKLSFNIGSLLWAQNRIRKESAVLSALLDALGELADADTLAAAKQTMIEGYSYSQQRSCFPSAALSSTLTGDELREAVWNEMLATGVPVLIDTHGVTDEAPEEDETPDSE